MLNRLQQDRIFLQVGNVHTSLSAEQTSAYLDEYLAQLPTLKRVLLLPPDITRLDSGAGPLTELLYQKLSPHAHVEILPALGTHFPMTGEQLALMFPSIPSDKFVAHDWKSEIVPLGEVPASFVEQVSAGLVNYSIPVLLNKKLVQQEWDQIISIGQAVPHEVVGIANHNKNVFVGTGGAEMINKTHYLGAVYGMERIMGQAQSPVRDVLDYAEQHFAARLPISYLLTVRGHQDQTLVTRGLFAGSGKTCFLQAAELARQVNIHFLPRAPQRVVVHMAAHEYHSTWLANKAIYRTRMAIATGGQLFVLAPGVKTCGEKPEIDTLIRKYGYKGSTYVRQQVASQPDLANNLSAAAHLIHGSSEGRFQIHYAPAGLSADLVKQLGYEPADLVQLLKRYPPEKLQQGWNHDAEGEFFYVNAAGQGLWSAPLDQVQA